MIFTKIREKLDFFNLGSKIAIEIIIKKNEKKLAYI